MVSGFFLNMALLGAEWVLYLLIALSVLSVWLIVDRIRFYRKAEAGLAEFREKVRAAAAEQAWQQIRQVANERSQKKLLDAPDFESGLSTALMEHNQGQAQSPKVLSEVANDALIRTRVSWERHLATLATIGSNAPFVGLFGTVLGIIQAFHHLNSQTDAGLSAVSAGISEALIATAVGILVAIPAVVAFNLFQRKVRAALSEAEALKSYLIGKMSD